MDSVFFQRLFPWLFLVTDHRRRTYEEIITDTEHGHRGWPGAQSSSHSITEVLRACVISVLSKPQKASFLSFKSCCTNGIYTFKNFKGGY